MRIEIKRGEFIRILQRHESERTIAVESDMAGRFRCGEALDQREIGTVVNIDAVQAQTDGDEPFFVRTETDLIGIRYFVEPALDVTSLGVEEYQVI